MRNNPRLWCRECGKKVARIDAVKSRAPRTKTGWTFRHCKCFEEYKARRERLFVVASVSPQQGSLFHG